MFYTEILGDTDAGEPYIKERGVFWNIAELAFYRAKGQDWQGSEETMKALAEYEEDERRAQACADAFEPLADM